MSVKKKDVSGVKAVKKQFEASVESTGPQVTVINASEKRSAKSRRTRRVKENPNKVSMARDSFTMPKDEYAQLKVLKTRLATLDRPAKKSELLRAGIKQLSLMTDAQLMSAIVALPVIKTGRPKKQNLI